MRIETRLADSPAKVGQFVWQNRKLQRLTQAELAHQAGVTRQTVSLIEKGAPGTKLDTLLKVMNVLGIGFPYLLESYDE